MEITMVQRGASVKSRKTAVFAAQTLPPCLMVNHF